MDPATSGHLPAQVPGVSAWLGLVADNPVVRTGTPMSIMGLLVWLLATVYAMRSDFGDVAAEVGALKIWQATHIGEHAATDKARAERIRLYEAEVRSWRQSRNAAYKQAGWTDGPPRVKP